MTEDPTHAADPQPILLGPARGVDLVSGEMDALTRLIGRLLQAPICLVSIVEDDQDRQVFAGATGLSEPWSTVRSTPLSHSFCRHVRDWANPMVIEDSRSHALVQANPAITDLGVAAYLGVPVRDGAGQVLGALCVIDTKPRDWTAEERVLMDELALCVSSEIALRSQLRQARDSAEAARARLAGADRYAALRESICQAFLAPDLALPDRLRALLEAGCTALDCGRATLVETRMGRPKVRLAVPEDGAPPPVEPRDGPTLTRMLMNALHIVDLPRVDARFADALRRDAGALIGAPLIRNGTMVGTVEFARDAEKPDGWSQEQLSCLTLVAMTAATFMQFDSEIETLRNSERALLAHLGHTAGPVPR